MKVVYVDKISQKYLGRRMISFEVWIFPRGPSLEGGTMHGIVPNIMSRDHTLEGGNIPVILGSCLGKISFEDSILHRSLEGDTI